MSLDYRNCPYQFTFGTKLYLNTAASSLCGNRDDRWHLSFTGYCNELGRNGFVWDAADLRKLIERTETNGEIGADGQERLKEGSCEEILEGFTDEFINLAAGQGLFHRLQAIEAEMKFGDKRVRYTWIRGLTKHPRGLRYADATITPAPERNVGASGIVDKEVSDVVRDVLTGALKASKEDAHC
jgi:hypothetical protein